jgi:hypothetical protein
MDGGTRLTGTAWLRSTTYDSWHVALYLYFKCFGGRRKVLLAAILDDHAAEIAQTWCCRVKAIVPMLFADYVDNELSRSRQRADKPVDDW